MAFHRLRALGLCAALVIVGLFAVDQLSLARPGGGQSYRSPSRSSYRSSSSSRRSSSSSHSRRSSRSSHVVVASTSDDSGSSGCSGSASTTVVTLIVALAFVGLVLFLISRKRPARAQITVDAPAQRRGIDALRQRDPGFDPAAFAERTRATMARVNEAWLAGHMGPARRLISDGVYVRFQTQLELLTADGVRNTMADWRVVSADILAAEGDDLWDTVHVKVVGEARDKDVRSTLSAEEAAAEARSAPLQSYHEVWSFLRRRGKTTKGSPALEGRCPSCGADLPLSEAVRCEFCQALVNSGEHDWVLAEITQPEEWSVWTAEEEVPGLAELRQRDPAVSRQELEDRASVIFWKWIEARRLGKVDNLARFCLERPDLSSGALGLQPARLGQVAAGSAELTNVAPGEPGGRDHVEVEIRWSASLDGKEPEGTENTFALERSVEAVSKRGLSSLDCPNCGGPVTESDATACGYCGEMLIGGKHEWALTEVS